MGKPLTLVFYDDGRVSTLVGHNKFPLEDIQVDAVNEAVTLIYVKEGSVCTPVYSLKAGDIKSAVNRAFKWKEDTKGREHIGLKEKLLVLLGYQAYQDLKEGIGRKYGILVEFDNGRKAYTGDESIAIHVPEGASKMETIVVTSIEEKMRHDLHDIIECFARGEERDAAIPIGRVGELIVYEKYSDKIKGLIIQKLLEDGVPVEEIRNLDKVVPEWFGTNVPGERRTDIVFRAQEEIVLGGKRFKKGDVVAVVEIKSTTKTYSESEFKERFGEAVRDLKNKYVNIEDYKTAMYGVAVAFGFEPEEMLWSLTLFNELSYPSNIGPYENPYIEVFGRGELVGDG